MHPKESCSSHKKYIIAYHLMLTGALFLLPPHAAIAADFAGSLDAVQVTDGESENKPPTAIINTTSFGNTFNFDGSASGDSDGTIVEYKWAFGGGTKAAGVTASHLFGNDGVYQVELTIIDDRGGVALRRKAVTIFHSAVNFQPATSTIPAGFVADSGNPFDAALHYGWTTSPGILGTRDRNSPISPDQAYDTFLRVVPTGVWEYAVPNGDYAVTVCVGDPSLGGGGVQNVQVETLPVIQNATFSTTTPWVEKNIRVSVSDGKITLSFLNTGGYAPLAWVKIGN